MSDVSARVRQASAASLTWTRHLTRRKETRGNATRWSCLDVSRRHPAKGWLMCRLDTSRRDQTCQKWSVTMEEEASSPTCEMSIDTWLERHLWLLRANHSSCSCATPTQAETCRPQPESIMRGTRSARSKPDHDATTRKRTLHPAAGVPTRARSAVRPSQSVGAPERRSDGATV